LLFFHCLEEFTVSPGGIVLGTRSVVFEGVRRGGISASKTGFAVKKSGAWGGS